jgi:hypothetical protein
VEQEWGETIKNLRRFSLWGEYVTRFAFPGWKDHPMKFTVQLVAYSEDGQEETPQEVVVLEKEYQQGEQLGLTLTEAKQLLKRLQHHVVERADHSLSGRTVALSGG